MARLKLGVLISGRGSNLRSLIAACSKPDYPAEIALVISNVPDAGGLAFAEQAGIRHVTIRHKDFTDRATFDTAVDGELRAAGVELVCLAGFMRILGPAFLERWHDRVVNIHPSLLPSFPGLHVHEQALAAGVRLSGCTVHIVRPAVDDGPILVQAAVPVASDDTPETLAARVLEAEHRIYPLAVKLMAEKRVRIEGRRALIDGEPAPKPPLLSPAD
ncbi:MAG: phosphoribosylglycinamide formyltransferase [Gemmatimonas sp.]